MSMSRALDRPEPIFDAAAAGDAAPVTASNAAFFRQPLAPILTAVGVTVLVVLAISFARTNGLVSKAALANYQARIEAQRAAPAPKPGSEATKPATI